MNSDVTGVFLGDYFQQGLGAALLPPMGPRESFGGGKGGKASGNSEYLVR